MYYTQQEQDGKLEKQTQQVTDLALIIFYGVGLVVVLGSLLLEFL